MRKNLKKLLSLVMTLSIVMSMLSVNVAAEETGTGESGYDPTNSYVLNYTGNYSYNQWQYFSISVPAWKYKGVADDNKTIVFTLYDTVNDKALPVYCTDIDTGLSTGSNFRRINLEDSSYYASGASGVLRSIALNGFLPDIDATADEVSSEVQVLASAAGIEGLTVSEAVAGTQLAIWQTAHGEKLKVTDFCYYYDTNWNPSHTAHYDESIADVAKYGLNEEDYYEAAGTEQEATIESHIEAVYDYLINLDSTEPTGVAVSSASFKEWSVPTFIDNGDETYDVAVTVTVDVEMTSADTLTLSAVMGEEQGGHSDYSASIALEDGENTKTLTIENVPAATADESAVILTIDGLQTVSDVFLFDSVGDRGESQSLIGATEQQLPVHAEISLAPIVLTKTATDNSGKFVKGAKFDLYYGSGSQDEYVKWNDEPYETDEEGKIIVRGLDPDYKYYFIEVEAPDGYIKKSEKIEVDLTSIDEEDSGVDYKTKVEVSTTNAYDTSTTDITVTKKWDDDGDRDQKRPANITVQLYADGAECGDPVVLTDTGNEWTYTWDDLPVYNDGEKIEYTVDEVKVETTTDEVTGEEKTIIVSTTPDGYDKDVDGLVITNSYEWEKTSVSVEKVWEDKNDQDGKRPDEIKVELYANDKKAETVTLKESNGWKHTWNDLPKNEAGVPINYTVKEVLDDETKEEYPTVSITGTAAEGYTITNTHAVEKISVGGFKVWDDENDYDGLRPESITVDLLANGEKVDSQTVTADVNGEWKWSFTDLDKYANGKEIKYSFIDKVDGYTATEGDISNNYNLTNTHKPEKVDVEGSKTWKDSNDQDGLRPESITINLLADGEKIDSKVVTSADGWKWSWTGLDKYKDGKAINYTVTEDAVPGYSTGVKGYDVTNTHETEDTQITVKKVWKDDGNRDGIRPASISVQLLADGKAHGEAVTLSAENGWSYTWTDLDKMYGGKEIKYSVDEISKVAGYVTAIDGFTITNTHEVEKTSVRGSKTWNDAGNQDGKRPASITINLLANGEKVDSKVVTAADGWKWSFTDLPKNDNGQEIVYTITEDAVPGYSTEVKGYDVTNSYTPGKTSVTVNKVWKDDGNRDGIRPVSISVQLLADGAAKGEPVTLTAENGWTYTWNGLDQMSGGKTISYTVAEVGTVEGYTSSVNGFTITNTHEVEKTSVSGSKTWKDSNDQDGLRPASITINLLANGEKVDSKVVTAADGWKWSFTGLNKNENGKAINYTITEDAVPGYSTEVNGYDVTNSYTPGKTSVTVNKVWKDDGNRDGIRPVSISVQLLADGAAKGEPVTLTAENGWTYTWNGLNEKSGGKTISYTVAEVGTVEGYISSVKGFTITNTHEVEKTSIDVEKVWERTSNPPEIDVIIKLLADGEEVKTLTLNEDNGWKGTFSDLPVNKDGKAITYTIEEVEVSGYSTKITGSAADGFTVINTKKGGDRPNDEEKEDEPSGGPKDVTYTLKADKTLDGKKANGFTFEVKDANGTVVATASAKSGKITFPTFRYDTEGTYTYTVSEVAGTNSNVTYDDSVYTLTVTVSKSGEELTAECTGLMKDGEAVESILFENTYDGERFYDDDEEELFEEDIPLGGLDVPETGDAGMLWALTAAVSGMGLAGLNFFPKKRKEDEE